MADSSITPQYYPSAIFVNFLAKPETPRNAPFQSAGIVLVVQLNNLNRT